MRNIYRKRKHGFCFQQSWTGKRENTSEKGEEKKAERGEGWYVLISKARIFEVLVEAKIDWLELIKGVEPAFVEKRGFLTGATDKTTLDFHNFFSGTDRTILDLETSPSKFF